MPVQQLVVFELHHLECDETSSVWSFVLFSPAPRLSQMWKFGCSNVLEFSPQDSVMVQILPPGSCWLSPKTLQSAIITIMMWQRCQALSPVYICLQGGGEEASENGPFQETGRSILEVTRRVLKKRETKYHFKMKICKCTDLRSTAWLRCTSCTIRATLPAVMRLSWAAAH